MTNNSNENNGSMKPFYLMWSGQSLSMIASMITNFALGLWVLNHTNTVSEFSIVFVLITLPGLLLSPFIGVWIDRYKRKTIIILADLVVAITTSIVAWLYWTGSLSVEHIYIVSVIDSIAFAFQMPASMAAISLLVPKEKLGKAAGLGEMAGSVAMILGPILAGLLLTVIDLFGILILDLASFLLAVVIMFFVKVPELDKHEDNSEESTSIWTEVKEGFAYITDRKGLLYLLGFFSLMNLVGAMVAVSIMPMGKHFLTEPQLGVLMAIGGAGGLLGGLYLASTGGPKRKINGVLVGGAAIGISMVVMSIQPSFIWICIGVFMFEALIPIVNGSSQVIWQRKVDPKVQGRVFSVRRMIAQISFPVGALSIGFLSDNMFEPLMATGGDIADIIGSGPGRGIALILLIVAIFPVIAALIGYSLSHLRNVDEQLPDMLPDTKQEK